MNFIRYKNFNPINLDHIISIEKYNSDNFFNIEFFVVHPNASDERWNFTNQFERNQVYDTIMSNYVSTFNEIDTTEIEPINNIAEL